MDQNTVITQSKYSIKNVKTCERQALKSASCPVKELLINHLMILDFSAISHIYYSRCEYDQIRRSCVEFSVFENVNQTDMKRLHRNVAAICLFMHKENRNGSRITIRPLRWADGLLFPVYNFRICSSLHKHRRCLSESVTVQQVCVCVCVCTWLASSHWPAVTL